MDNSVKRIWAGSIINYKKKIGEFSLFQKTSESFMV